MKVQGNRCGGPTYCSPVAGGASPNCVDVTGAVRTVSQCKW
jgi:hypothetical protein